MTHAAARPSGRRLAVNTHDSLEHGLLHLYALLMHYFLIRMASHAATLIAVTQHYGYHSLVPAVEYLKLLLQSRRRKQQRHSPETISGNVLILLPILLTTFLFSLGLRRRALYASPRRCYDIVI